MEKAVCPSHQARGWCCRRLTGHAGWLCRCKEEVALSAPGQLPAVHAWRVPCQHPVQQLCALLVLHNRPPVHERIKKASTTARLLHLTGSRHADARFTLARSVLARLGQVCPACMHQQAGRELAAKSRLHLVSLNVLVVGAPNLCMRGARVKQPLGHIKTGQGLSQAACVGYPLYQATVLCEWCDCKPACPMCSVNTRPYEYLADNRQGLGERARNCILAGFMLAECLLV